MRINIHLFNAASIAFNPSGEMSESRCQRFTRLTSRSVILELLSYRIIVLNLGVTLDKVTFTSDNYRFKKFRILL